MLPSKDEQRKKLKTKLLSLNPKDRESRSIEINSNLTNLLSKFEIQTLCIFIPTKYEPNINIDSLLKKYKSVYCPKFIEKKYIYYKIHNTNELKLGNYNILEPTSNSPINNKSLQSNTSFFLVPLVGFDPLGNRLGHGNGYYDQLLKNVDGIKIGIGFSIQETPLINSEAHDQPLNYIITENKIINTSQSSPES